MEQRIPPHSLEAERGLLGALLTDPQAIYDIGPKLTPEDFYREAHAAVYTAIQALYERQEPADLLTVTEELARTHKIDLVGGASALADLTGALPTVAHASAYCDIVRDRATRRRLISTAQEILEDAFHGADAAREVVDRAEQRVFGVASGESQASGESVGDLLEQTMENVQRYQERQGAISGMPTGFRDLDEMTDGLQGSELIIVAARPSMGKTSFALNLALRAAIDHECASALFSLETSKQQLTQNLLSMEARVDAHQLRRGRLNEGAYRDLISAAGRLNEAPIYVFDTPGISIMELRGAVRRLKKKDARLGLVMIDYLQLMEARMGGQTSREQEVSYLSRSLKALAREMNLPVVALSQLNRSVENRADFKPRMSDLRESGAIEQDADVILLLHREGYYNPARGDDGKTEIIIAKQRNGPVGSVYLTFLKRYLRFESWTEENAQVAAPDAVDPTNFGF